MEFYTLLIGFIVLVLSINELTQNFFVTKDLKNSLKIVKLNNLNNKYRFKSPQIEFKFEQKLNSFKHFRQNTLDKTIKLFLLKYNNEILSSFKDIESNFIDYKDYIVSLNKLSSIITNFDSNNFKFYTKRRYLRLERKKFTKLIIKPQLVINFDVFFSYTSPAGRNKYVSTHFYKSVENIIDFKSTFEEVFSKYLENSSQNIANITTPKQTKGDILISSNINNFSTSHLGRLDAVRLKNVKDLKGDRFLVKIKIYINILGKISYSLIIIDLDINQEIDETRFKHFSSENVFSNYTIFFDLFDEFHTFESGEKIIKHAKFIKKFYFEKKEFEVNLNEITLYSAEDIVKYIKFHLFFDKDTKIQINSINIGLSNDYESYKNENPSSRFTYFADEITFKIREINNSKGNTRKQKLIKLIKNTESKFVSFVLIQTTSLELVFEIKNINIDLSLGYIFKYLNQNNNISRSDFLNQTINEDYLNFITNMTIELNTFTSKLMKYSTRINLLFNFFQTYKNKINILLPKIISESNEWKSKFDIISNLNLISIDSLEESNLIISNNLKNHMRDYQKYGFNWLAKLAYNGLSGILADDMGLGKSLEIISLIEADSDDLPILILSPLSVVNNWKSEFEKWAPNIRVYIINGQSKYLMNSSISRKKTVFITSYEFLTYNLNFIKKFHFKYFIIDEAQYIKNKNTIRSESVKQVSSNIRFALTGTPIENHEDDLWNIFDFLYPKIFKFYNNKISNFNKREYIKPFILRRKKSEVLKELPLKTEVIVPLEMTMKQKEIYDYYNNLNLDFKDSALDLLVHLTRLRQICITPKLLDESIQSDSVKLNYLNEKILEITQLDESVLIFSSFTTTFKFIEEILNERNILFKKLTGEMNLSERQNAINEFNLNKNIKVFLISLKTGGVGLNLVKANNVIFVDPWWNIAAENQASDRVHRIGQSKNVMVYKLIVSNSIEEYVMSVQNNKLNIINYFIEVGTNKPLEKLDLKTLKDLLIKSQNN